MNKGRWRGMLLLSGVALLLPGRTFAIATTTVAGVVYRADGTAAQGTMLVSWPAFTAADGSAVAAGTSSTTLAADGSVNLTLAPNAGANPQGTYYTVVYHMSDGTVEKEYWVVPQGTTTTVAAIRAKVVPAVVAVQSVTPQFVNGAVSSAFAGLGTAAMQPSSAFDGAGAAAAAQAAAEAYTDTHSASLPADAIPFQPTGGPARAATHTDVNVLYNSTAWESGTVTQLSTTFNEGGANSSLSGTSPATNLGGSSWITWPTQQSVVFASGGGAVSNAANQGDVIDTGLSAYTVTFSGLSNTATYVVSFSGASSAENDRLDLWILGSGGVALKEVVGGTVNTVQTQATANGATGSVTAVVNGSTITVTAFGGAPMSYTIPAGHADIGGHFIGILSGGSGYTYGGVTVTGTGLGPTTVACAGFYNADGTCSTSGANSFAANDSNGHQAPLPEKGTKTDHTGNVTIAWQDDLSAGEYDPRDPRWGAQDTPAHQAAALQAMSDQMACDLAMGKVVNARAKFPQGTFYADQLLLAPGSTWEGVATSDGGTTLASLYLNHQLVQAPYQMTVTCSDGQSHTLTPDTNTVGTHVSHFRLGGCGNGGCTNASGDTNNYLNGGPGNVGLEMSSPGGVVEYVVAQNFGGYGIRVDGQDAKAFHLRLYNDSEWYYFGGYKGAGESVVSPQTTAVTTGSTGSIALSWAAVSGATGYVVYRGSSSGGEDAFYMVSTNSLTDTGTGTLYSGVVPPTFTTTNASAPGTVTAAPSSSGGTLAAGTYYYVVTTLGPDVTSLYNAGALTPGYSNVHGNVEMVGTDNMADWVETYGFLDAPTIFTWNHLADFLGGGGYSHFDHIWAQLGLIGVMQPYGFGGFDVYENVRIDFTRTTGFKTDDTEVQVNGGNIDGSCTAPNALTIDQQLDTTHYSGSCVQFYDTGDAGSIANVTFSQNPGFGASVETADMLLGQTTAHSNVSGSYQIDPDDSEVLSGSSFAAPNGGITPVTGPMPNVLGLERIYPNDTTPTTYYGFMNLAYGQDLYVYGGDSNATIPNNTYIKTCSGQNINLGSVSGALHFVYQQESKFGNPGYVWQVCGGASIAPSSETVAYSATPTFSIATRASLITLTGNVTGFTLAAGSDGQEKTLEFCQNSTGGYTVTPPMNVRGFFTIGKTASQCSAQHFIYSTTQGAWLADSPGVVNE